MGLYLNARQIGYTSGPGEGGIMHHRDYDRKFSPHVVSHACLFSDQWFEMFLLLDRLGGVCRDDLALSGNPLPALV